MQDSVRPNPPRYRGITRTNVGKTPQWERIPAEYRRALEVTSTVLPFKTNQYVMDELIDWDRIPDDPMFVLNFLQPGMLGPAEFSRMARLLDERADKAAIKIAADEIRRGMNPHPAGQRSHNVPSLDGRPLDGVQHKYRETVLFFPSQGQTCHAYCTFCFRWPQFVGLDDMKFAAKQTTRLCAYLESKKDVTDVLVTGGDPLVMSTGALRRTLEPLLSPGLEHVTNIRIGTKSVAYWPHRFVSDADADDLLRLFDEIIDSGRHLAIMGHYNHPAELRPRIAQRAVERIRSTGATVRMQSPLLRHINDSAADWVELWRRGVKLGAVPYYMFVERDTGPRDYFAVPLARAWHVFRDAYQCVSGLGRTVRGPSMSAFPGKVAIVGVADAGGEKVFVLEFLQARDPDWVRRPFFAKFDENARWLTDLQPAFGEERFFFEPDEPSVPGRAFPKLNVVS